MLRLITTTLDPKQNIAVGTGKGDEMTLDATTPEKLREEIVKFLSLRAEQFELGSVFRAELAVSAKMIANATLITRKPLKVWAVRSPGGLLCAFEAFSEALNYGLQDEKTVRATLTLHEEPEGGGVIG